MTSEMQFFIQFWHFQPTILPIPRSRVVEWQTCDQRGPESKREYSNRTHLIQNMVDSEANKVFQLTDFHWASVKEDH